MTAKKMQLPPDVTEGESLPLLDPVSGEGSASGVGIPQNPAGWRGVLRWLPGVLISVVVLVLIFQIANWQDLGRALSSIQIPNLIVAIGLTIVSLGTRAMAWKVLLNHKPRLSQAFFIINEGYLLNNLFPFRLGEVGRAVLMGQATGFGPFRVLSSIVLERAFDLAAAATLLLLTLPLALNMDWAKPLASLTLFLVGAGLAALYFVARNRNRFEKWLGGIAQRSTFFKKHILHHLEALISGLGVLNSPWQFLQSLFWIAASWAIWVLVYYVMLLPIAPSAPLWWAAFSDGVLAMGVAIPSAPAALGVFEGSLAGALSLVGVPFSIALGYAILMHFLQFSITGILGLWGLMREGRSLKVILAELRKPFTTKNNHQNGRPTGTASEES